MTHDKLRQIATACTMCDLHKGRTNPVFSRGNPEARLMICGMVPGPDENKGGLPFIGRAGQLLEKIMAQTDITIDNVYITNLVKCWLQSGLDLKPEWIASCLQYIIAQISLIRPSVIVTLGLPASITLLGLPEDVRMGRIRGKVYTYSVEPKIEIIPTYHPSFLLRGGGEKSDYYPKVLEDFELAMYVLAQIEEGI